jgi:hypothetical protein
VSRIDIFEKIMPPVIEEPNKKGNVFEKVKFLHFRPLG